MESLVDNEAIPFSVEVDVTVGPGLDPEPAVWLKSPSFVESCYIPYGGGDSTVYSTDVRFGTANLPQGTDFELRILRRTDSKEPVRGTTIATGYHSDTYWISEGTDIVFEDISSHLPSPITTAEIVATGAFPFRLVVDDGVAVVEYPDDDLGGGGDHFSLSLNNRTITANEFRYYSMKPGHAAWRTALGNECALIVSGGDDWYQNRPVYEGVFADVVEGEFPPWVDLLLPYDLDDPAYGEDMRQLCVEVKGAMDAVGGGLLMVNGGGDSIFTQESEIDRVMCDGVIKLQKGFRERSDAIGRINRVRSVVVDAATISKPVHIKSHAGIVEEDAVQHMPFYRLMEIAGFFLVMNDGVTDQQRTVMGYVGRHAYNGRIMAFPEAQLDLGTPDGDPQSIAAGTEWYLVRQFEGGESYAIYNCDTYGSQVTYSPAQMVDKFYDPPTGDWYRLVVDDDLTTTEGGSFRFEAIDLGAYQVSAGEGLIIMRNPPVLPEVLEDAHSPVWLTGGEQELELRVMHDVGDSITLCKASIHEFSGATEPGAQTTISLVDDGTGGDDVSGDGVFTADLSGHLSGVTPGEYVVWTRVEDDQGYYQYGRTKVVVASDDLLAKFQDFSAESDIDYTGVPYSSLAFDGNEDGFEDILVTIQVQRSSSQVKYLTDPTGCPIYHERINEDYFGSDFQTATDCRGLALGDYDNDGDEDLFAAHGTALLLMENTGPQPIGQFDDASVTGLTATITEDSWAGAWGDYNADGWLDLYISRADLDAQNKDFLGADPVSDRLMLGVDGTTLVPSSHFSGVLPGAQPSFSATWCDVDRDGDMDLFVPASNANGTSAGARFYETVSGMQFQDGLASWFPDAEIANATSAAWADLDNDGDLDLVLSQLAGLQPGDPARPSIFLNNDDEDSFTQETTALPVVDLPTWDVRPMDFDLDGWTDLLLVPAKLDAADPDRAPKLYRNAGVDPLEFEDVSDVVFPASLASVINGAAPADYDLDGDLDLFLGRPTAGDAGFYYLSEPTGTPNHWLGVKLESSGDIVANRSGIGAQVMVTDLNGDTILAGAQNYGGGAGRGGDSSRGLRFGLGGTTGPVVVKTHWLNGHVQRDTVAVDQVVTVHDETPPTIATGSVNVQSTLAPGQLTWGFDWDSEFLLADSVDQVILNGPSTNWANVTITPANATHVVNGKSHALLGFVTDCAKGLHTITVTMSSNGQTHSTVTTHSLRMCISGF